MSPGDCIWNVFEITTTSNLFEIGIFCFHSHAAHTYKGSSPVVIILVNFVTDCNIIVPYCLICWGKCTI